MLFRNIVLCYNMTIRDIISKIPCNADKKLRLFKFSRNLFWKLRYSSEMYQFLKSNQPLIPQNYSYGHEYWLKTYSDYNDYIYGLVEHGIFAKDDHTKVGWDVEWDIGSIFTFGNARYETLTKLYPDFNIIRIGPRIHYVQYDDLYYKELRSQIDNSSKTIVLFPSHSLASETYKYDVEMFLTRAINFAKGLGIKNVLVSLHPSDILHGFQDKYREFDKRIITVTGGNNPLLFLSRLKTILSIADISYSNKFGTHVGYSLYMNKPHIIDTSSDSIMNNTIFSKDYDLITNQFFSDAFKCNDNPWEITKEQYDLTDYYFGFSHTMSPKMLFKELENAKILYNNRFGLH